MQCILNHFSTNVQNRPWKFSLVFKFSFYQELENVASGWSENCWEPIANQSQFVSSPWRCHAVSISNYGPSFQFGVRAYFNSQSSPEMHEVIRTTWLAWKFRYALMAEEWRISRERRLEQRRTTVPHTDKRNLSSACWVKTRSEVNYFSEYHSKATE